MNKILIEILAERVRYKSQRIPHYLVDRQNHIDTKIYHVHLEIIVQIISDIDSRNELPWFGPDESFLPPEYIGHELDLIKKITNRDIPSEHIIRLLKNITCGYYANESPPNPIRMLTEKEIQEIGLDLPRDQHGRSTVFYQPEDEWDDFKNQLERCNL